MKKTYLVIISLITIQSSYSQSFTIGAKGMYGLNWMLNQNINNDEHAKYEGNSYSSAGLSFAWYFVSRSYYSSVVPGVNIDVLYSTHNQSVKGLDSLRVNQSVTINYLDIPVLFRITPEFGPYFEIGVQTGILMSAKGEYTSTSPKLPDMSLNGDIKSKINPINLSAVVGGGVDIDLSDYITIMFGFRVSYGFTDITSPQKNMKSVFDSYEPTNLVGVSGLGGIVYTLNYFH